MKKLFGVLMLTSAACQQQDRPTQVTVKNNNTSVVAEAAGGSASIANSQSPNAPSKEAPVDSFTAAVLTPPNLVSLFQSTHNGDTDLQPMNGFFGPDLYRIEVVLTQVKRDPHQSGCYLVQGKDRYKGVITPLAGWILVRQVTVQNQTATDVENKEVLLKSYAISGIYELREEASARGAGIFRGQLAVDMMLNDGKPITETLFDSLSKGGMTTFDGTWTNSVMGQQKAAIWVTNLYGYRGAKMVNDFFIGEREASINPKYAKLGWNTYWENDEWWATSPKPRLSLRANAL